MEALRCALWLWETTCKNYNGGLCSVWGKGEPRWHCLCVGSGEGALQWSQNTGQPTCHVCVCGGVFLSSLRGQTDKTQEGPKLELTLDKNKQRTLELRKR